MRVLEVENLSFYYRRGEYILKDISFGVEEGELFAILGPNGAGKTTLLRLLMGFLKPVSGRIKIFGRELRHFGEWRRIGYVPQRFSVDRFFTGSVGELFKSLAQREKVGWVIAYLHLESLLDRPFVKLSGGEQQKVLLALALTTNPDLLVLDEPTTGLDIHAQEHMESILRELKGKKTILLVSHDIGFVLRNADRLLCLGVEMCRVVDTQTFKGMVRELYGLH